MTRADARVLFALSAPDLRRDAKGKVSGLSRRFVCAEPSPDVAKAISTALSGAISAAGGGDRGKGEVNASLERTLTESIAQLGQRLATIQLLRDELSDLCRAYANGAVSKMTYTLRLSRLDRKMITLLISEASAGALSRGLVALTGTAEVSRGAVDQTLLKRADDRIVTSSSNLTVLAKQSTAKQEELANAKKQEPVSNETIAKLEMQVKDLESAISRATQEVSDAATARAALDLAANKLVASRDVKSVGALADTNILDSVNLSTIHRSYMDDVDIGVIMDACLTAMEDNAPQDESPVIRSDRETKLKSLETDIDGLEKTRQDQYREFVDVGGNRTIAIRGGESAIVSIPTRDELERQKKEAKEELERQKKQDIAFDVLKNTDRKLDDLREQKARLRGEADDASRTGSIFARWCEKQGMKVLSDLVRQQMVNGLAKRLAQEDPSKITSMMPAMVLSTCANLYGIRSDLDNADKKSISRPQGRSADSEPQRRFDYLGDGTVEGCTAALMSQLLKP